MCCLSLTSGYQTLHPHYHTIYSALEVSFRIINMAQFSPCILIPGESVICSCRTHRCPQWKNTDSYPWKCVVSGIIQIQAQGICICISQIKSGKPSMTFHRFQCSFFLWDHPLLPDGSVPYPQFSSALLQTLDSVEMDALPLHRASVAARV